ncbi:uncharacterized protein EAE98_003377 [Botrytis deweyae]|uniref:Fungal-type protein kinase domain-containing protein n=1 Tax=Botrytis deweyae TaxID=2478750 RepID=A0ABQ7IU63_9HELO|nr:uncharacterized protein EAE98_003377 [Botrytis deweyae]KAF7920667.1 hypothetical protein EAE99_007961 [Botrytis elliptica]KAF7933668.1 hypothetical protein EAE98_003377 [Botrytis deweyae]
MRSSDLTVLLDLVQYASRLVQHTLEAKTWSSNPSGPRWDLRGKKLLALANTKKVFGVFKLEAYWGLRDKSRQNIIIISPLFSDSPAGILTNLDGALDLMEPLLEIQLLISTSGFMACGILGGDDHIYRHDLESFFYVFLWLAIFYDEVTSKYILASSHLYTWMGLLLDGILEACGDGV